MKKLTLITTTLFLISCSSKEKTIDLKAEGEKLMLLSQEWSKVAGEGDPEKTLRYWADNAVLIAAGEPVLTGKQEIRKMVEASYRMPGFKISWQPLNVEISASGDMGYILENSQVSFTDSTGQPVTIHNKAVSIWRKQADGSWKNAVDISTPAAVLK